MKHTIFAILALVSAVSVADEVRVGRQAHPVRVNAAFLEIVGDGFPSTEVRVTATFGNFCEVPLSDELVTITQYSKNFDNLNISLGIESERACPAVYQPVTATIFVGLFTRPNDGLFERITVNGKVAKKQ